MRILQSFIVLTLTALLCCNLALAYTPTIINYQGRLTDASGSPVADGPYLLDFKLFDISVGGTLLWSEIGVPVTTEKGLFTTQLGTPTPFPSGFYDSYAGEEDIFQHAPELWLEIKVGPTTLTPRTRLIAVPYAVVAHDVSGRASWNPNVGIETNSAYGLLENFGNDATPRFWLAGNNWGQFLLYDGTPTLEVNLAANIGGGGSLELGNGVGGWGIQFFAGSTGNGSVNLPADAISAPEILDEPGISSNRTFSSIGLVNSEASSTNFVSTTITIPSSGYIVVDAIAYTIHNGPSDVFAWAQISETSGAAFLGFTEAQWINSKTYANASSSYAYQSTPVKRTFFHSAGTYTFYFQGNAYSGNTATTTVTLLSPTRIQATYFPTSYGGVSSLAESQPTDNPEAEAVNVTEPMSHSTSTAYRVDLRYYELQVKRAEAELLKAQLALKSAGIAANAIPAAGKPNGGGLESTHIQK